MDKGKLKNMQICAQVRMAGNIVDNKDNVFAAFDEFGNCVGKTGVTISQLGKPDWQWDESDFYQFEENMTAIIHMGPAIQFLTPDDRMAALVDGQVREVAEGVRVTERRCTGRLHPDTLKRKNSSISILCRVPPCYSVPKNFWQPERVE